MADYELWMTDDAGRRLLLLKDLSFFSYTRIASRLGVINLGIPVDALWPKLNPLFAPDRRVEVWRSPAYGVPLRREDVFMLRKPVVYTRDDNVQIIQYYGRNGMDLLNRRSVIQRPGTSFASKTDEADDMMKAIVRQQMLYGSALNENGVVDNTRAWPQNEFRVQADLALGPTFSMAFADKRVFDILKDIQQATFQYHVNTPTSKKIYFDVVPVDISGSATAYSSPVGWEFRTYAEVFGTDRTTALEFSLENENITDVTWDVNHLEEVNTVIVKGNGQGLSQLVSSLSDSLRVNYSRWNRVEKVVSASNQTTTAALQDVARSELYKGREDRILKATLVNSPGSQSSPRSLYGLDWDLGDRIRINYVRNQFNMDIDTIHVAVDENGKETITGTGDETELLL